VNPLAILNPAGQPPRLFSTRLGQLAARLAPAMRNKALPPPFGQVMNHLNQPATPRQEAMDNFKANLLVKDAGY
jgi:hypothetical protein